MRVESNLLKLITDMNIPNYAFKKIMEWAKDAYNSGYQFNPKATSYHSQIKQLESFSNLSSVRPYVKPIALQNSLDDPSDTTTLNVVCCDFTSMLFSLLQDKKLNTESNLVVNKNDHFAKYVSPNGKLGEVNSGLWYEQAYSTMVKDPSKDFLLPIIFAMDKTTISNSASMSVYPVMFTTTIFDCGTRNKAHAWHPLGYIPIEKNYYSKAQWKKMDRVLKSQRENQLYEIVLQSFKQAQKDGELDNVELRLGDQIKMVNLKVPLAFIIGDIQGGDGICGRSAYYGKDARRICCMCDATPAIYDSKNDNKCNLLVMEDMKQLCINKDLEKLYDLMQYPNWQAFYDIDYGDLPGGVFTAACPPEALHSLENGLVLHCLKEMFESVMSERTKTQMDAVVQHWVAYPRQHLMRSYMDNFPRLLYRDGLTNITDISAGTKMGILFALVVAAQTIDGYEVLHLQNKTSENYANMINAFEMLLCYWVWLKKEEYWNCHDKEALEAAKQAINVTTRMLIVLFPCTKGSQW